MITHKGVLFLAIICVLFMSVSVSAIGSQGGSYTEAIMHYDDVKKEFIVVGVNEDVDVSFTEACYDPVSYTHLTLPTISCG